jgi:hypothetical protein
MMRMSAPAEVLGEVVGQGVEQPGKPQRGVEPQLARLLGGHVEQPRPQPAHGGVWGLLQRDDAGADLADRASALNCPRADSVRYRLPNTSSWIRIGTPRKLVIGGAPAGTPTSAGCSLIWRSRIGPESSISAPNSPFALR